MQIILVHGIFDTGHIFKHLERKLGANDHECYAPNLKPADARLGIADLGEKLKDYIAEHTESGRPIAIIGFSMGCLISRYYLQHLEGHKRTKAFFSISGPHQGTLTAYFYPGKGVKDMRPNSDFLTGLRASEDKLAGIALYSYRTPFDALIVPSGSSDWSLAKNTKVNSLAHRLMLKDRRVSDNIIMHLDLLPKNRKLENQSDVIHAPSAGFSNAGA